MTAYPLEIDVMSDRTAKHPSAKFWDKMAPKYAKNKIDDQAGYERSLARTRDFLSPDDRVLEIGCGTGTTALHHAPYVKHITGTDISAQMINIANEKVMDGAPLNAEFITAQADDLPFANASFDVAMAHNLLHLVDDLAMALKATHRVVKPGGIFITKTPCLGNMNFLMRKAVLPIMTRFYGIGTVNMFTVDQLEKAISQAGFSIEHTEFHASKGRDTRPFIVAIKR